MKHKGYRWFFVNLSTFARNYIYVFCTSDLSKRLIGTPTSCIYPFIMDKTAEQIRSKLDRPIVMIGLMGAGKTDMGGRLAKALGLNFVDSDDIITERAEGLMPTEVFQQMGEEHFRKLEREVIRDILAGPVQVVSTGGGAMMQPQTAELVWAGALSIWLKANIDTYLARIGNPASRPMLHGGDPKAIMEDLIKRRYPVYEKASMVVDANGDKKTVLNNCLAALNEYYDR